jgi:hypothetical protein
MISFCLLFKEFSMIKRLAVPVIFSSKSNYFEYPNFVPDEGNFRSTLLSLEDILPNELDEITKNFIKGIIDTPEFDKGISSF